MEVLKKAREFILGHKILSIVAGIAIGVAISVIFSGKTTGASGIIPSLIIRTESFGVHVHHWILGLLLLFMMLKVSRINSLIRDSRYYNVILGMPIGMILQGILMYSDWYVILH